MMFFTYVVMYGLGILTMKSIREFLKREERKKVKNETPYFKQDNVRFYSKEFFDGTIEFWAYPLPDSYTSDGVTVYKPNLWYGSNPIYLGRVLEDELVKPDNFYSLTMPIQRGALKLFKMAGVYV